MSSINDNLRNWRSAIAYFLPFLSAVAVCLAYLLEQQYPALAGGFYIAVGNAVLDSFPQVATTVPHYTYDGVRLGMPPFAASIAALLSRAVGPITVALVLPPIYHLGATVAGVYLGKTYLDTDTGISWLFVVLVGIVLGTSPAAYFWHITAGGTVRALAYVLFLLVVAVTIQVFRDGYHQRTLRLGILVGLAASSHPFYGLMSCLTVFSGFLAYDLTIEGFKRGTVIAAATAVLVFIWMIPFTLNHGPDLYLGVSQTRGGIIHFTWKPISRIFNWSFRGDIRPFWVYLGILGLFASAVQQRHFLLGLLAVTVYIIPRPRFMIVPLVMISGVLIFKDLPHVLRYLGIWEDNIRYINVTLPVIIAILLLPTVIMGITFEHTAFVDEHGVDIANWAEEDTSTEATFIITDDFAEWFPLLADRTSLVAARGSEWDPAGVRARELHEKNTVQKCETVACIQDIAQSQPRKTDYVVVPRETVVSNAATHEQSKNLLRGLQVSDDFTKVYQNDGYTVFVFNSSGKSRDDL